jgi:gamma-glutamyltranspeptidase/glutathione hydrolase
VDVGGTRVFALHAGYGGGHFMAAFDKKGEDASTGEAPTAGATGFVVADKNGGAVACGLTMGRAFGLGIMPPNTGFLLAPAPDAPGVAAHVIAPVLGIDIAANRLVFAAASAGEGAIAEAARATRAVVAENKTLEDAVPGSKTAARATLVNMLACRSQNESATVCLARNDPRGDGYAITLTPRK